MGLDRRISNLEGEMEGTGVVVNDCPCEVTHTYVTSSEEADLLGSGICPFCGEETDRATSGRPIIVFSGLLNPTADREPIRKEDLRHDRVLPPGVEDPELEQWMLERLWEDERGE